MKEELEINYDRLIDKIPNKYVLTIVAGRRARDIEQSKEPLIKLEKRTTVIRRALVEIMEGKVEAQELNEDEK